MNITVQTKIKRKIYDAATGELLKASPWEKNLVMDLGLNNLARGPGTPTSPANSFTNMIVGSGTNPVKVASGAVTFTQAGTTLTASAGFFNIGMLGTLFKYGTGSGGAEYYIIGYSDTQNVTVDTNATVGTPTLGTVWYVNQTALQTYAHASTSYRTNAGDNFTAFSLGQVTMQRSFVIASQGTTYTVNEIGWNGNARRIVHQHRQRAHRAWFKRCCDTSAVLLGHDPAYFHLYAGIPDSRPQHWHNHQYSRQSHVGASGHSDCGERRKCIGRRQAD